MNFDNKYLIDETEYNNRYYNYFEKNIDEKISSYCKELQFSKAYEKFMLSQSMERKKLFIIQLNILLTEYENDS